MEKMTVTLICEGNDKRLAIGMQLVRFFLGCFLITWGLAILWVLFPGPLTRILGPMSATNPIFFLAVSAPSLLAVVLTWFEEGGQGVIRLLRQLVKLPSRWQWYAVVFGGMCLVDFLATEVRHLGDPSARTFSLGAWLYAVATLPIFWTSDPGPLGEEFGWRGYALPRLLRLTTPFSASVLLGLMWGIWHAPAFFIKGTPQSSLLFASFLVGTLTLSIVMTWVFRSTQSVLLAGVILHFLANRGLAGASSSSAFVYVVVAMTLLAVTRGQLISPLPRNEASNKDRQDGQGGRAGGMERPRNGTRQN